MIYTTHDLLLFGEA